MKKTPLYEQHLSKGAKMVDFAGYAMPVHYTNIREEHFVVREKVGVFDVSHMGEFIIRGKEALALIQKVTSNDASRLQIGDAQYSCLPNEEGGIVDDLLVYRLPEDTCAEGEQAFMLVVNASNIEKDWKWIESHNNFDTRMINISDQTGLLAVQGPLAAKALQPLTDIDLSGMKYYSFAKGRFAGFNNVLISATGYTGSGGFEIYADASQLTGIWDAVFEAGNDYGIQAAGLGARDTLRLEMGYCLYGNDIDDTTSPLEAGLGWITRLKKGPFISQQFLENQKAEGLTRRLAGFVVNSDRRVPRHGYIIENGDGQEIGYVTSGTQSPSLDKPIGMGYVKADYSKEGTEIYFVAGKKKIPATIVKIPFIKI